MFVRDVLGFWVIDRCVTGHVTVLRDTRSESVAAGPWEGGPNERRDGGEQEADDEIGAALDDGDEGQLGRRKLNGREGEAGRTNQRGLNPRPPAFLGHV